MALGRRCKLTPELQEKVCDVIRKGNYIEVACGYVGINAATYYNWMKKGRAEKSGKFLDFLNAVKKAEESAEVMYLDEIRKASSTSWQAAAWYLERKYPDRWGRKLRTEETNVPTTGEVDHQAILAAIKEIESEGTGK